MGLRMCGQMTFYTGTMDTTLDVRAHGAGTFLMEPSALLLLIFKILILHLMR